MQGNFPAAVLSRTLSRFQKRNGNSSTCTHFRRIKNVSRRTVVVHDGCRAVLLLIKPTGFCRSRYVVVVVVVDLKVPQYCVHDIVYLFQLFIELLHFLKNLCVTRFNFGKILQKRIQKEQRMIGNHKHSHTVAYQEEQEGPKYPPPYHRYPSNKIILTRVPVSLLQKNFLR